MVTLLVAVSLLAGDEAADARHATSQEATASQEARPLTPQERRGKAIYLRGESASGREIAAAIGELDVPASTVTCAGCHGLRGEGKTEGGVTAGALTWSHLVKPYGHTHPSGRKHGPFDEAAFARAVSKGIDPDGNDLLVAMPRYRMAAEDLADLVAYLKRIESERDPGLDAGTVRVGVPLPSKGALAETGAAMKEVLAAYFAGVNERGGIYNRKVELSVADAGDAAGVEAARASVRRGEVFAFVGGVTAGVDREVAALARDEEIPFVGAVTLLPQSEAPPNRYVFYFLPGVREQARALVNFAAAKPELKQARAVVLHAGNELAVAA
ncbi:MAG TPA: ABC transporter substrate-binding protein, partial [Pyrinomonadaceae bacterium]